MGLAARIASFGAVSIRSAKVPIRSLRSRSDQGWRAAEDMILFTRAPRTASPSGGTMMKPTRKLNRRSFLGTVAGGVAGAGALAAVSGEAHAFQSGCSDSDPN